MDERHEGLHLDEVGDATWQENLYFCGFDERHNGFAIHAKLIPADQQVQIRALVSVGDKQYTVGVRRPLHRSLSYPEYQASNPEPFRSWKLQLNAVGYPSRHAAGYMGLNIAELGGDALPVNVTVALSTSLMPIDWSVLTSGTGAGHGHYDHAHTWTGSLSIGDDSISTSGLGIRDHSWGPRDLAGIEGVTYVATVSPELTQHRTGVAGRREGHDFGFGFLATGADVTTFPKPTVEVIDGSFDDADISQVRIVNAGQDVIATTHTEILMPLLRDGYLSRDLIGTTSSGGFSFVEYGTGLGAAAVAKIRREASALS
jgi:hypothetical protein